MSAASDPVSLLDGGSLPASVEVPESLADVLLGAADDSAGRGVLLGGTESSLSYRTLCDDALRLLHGLRRAGQRPGDRVIVLADEAAATLRALWCVVLGGGVPVPLPVPSALPDHRTSRRLAGIAEQLGVVTVIAADDDIAERARAVLDPKTATLLVADGLDSDGSTAEPTPRAGDDDALLLATSGSSASPKLVRLTHRNVLASLAASAWVNGLTERDVSLNWLPLQHVGGLMRALRDTFVRCTQVQVPTEIVRGDMLGWLDLLEAHQATFTWAPNTALVTLLEQARDVRARGPWNLSTVRSLYLSGEPALARTVARFVSLLEPSGLRPTAIQVAWGMTEACFATSYRVTPEDLSGPTEDVLPVGRPVPGVLARVVGDDGAVAPMGTVGELEIRGPLVSVGYLGEETSSRATGGWLPTGDLAKVVEQTLFVTGRLSERIIIGGVSLSPSELEAMLASDDSSAPSGVVCGVRLKGADTEEVAVFFHGSGDPVAIAHTIRAKIVARLGLTPRFVYPLPPDEDTAGSLGKITRRHLRSRLVDGDATLPRVWPFDIRATPPARDAGEPRADGLTRKIAAVMAQVVGRPAVTPDENFFALGGSSLEAARAATRLGEMTGLAVTPMDLLRAPTPRLLASLLDRGRETDAAGSGAARGALRRRVRRSGARR